MIQLFDFYLQLCYATLKITWNWGGPDRVIERAKKLTSNKIFDFNLLSNGFVKRTSRRRCFEKMFQEIFMFLLN